MVCHCMCRDGGSYDAWLQVLPMVIKTLKARRNGRHFADKRLKEFSWMKIYEFWLLYRWSLFLRFKLTIFHHWLRLFMDDVKFSDAYMRRLASVSWQRNDYSLFVFTKCQSKSVIQLNCEEGGTYPLHFLPLTLGYIFWRMGISCSHEHDQSMLRRLWEIWMWYTIPPYLSHRIEWQKHTLWHLLVHDSLKLSARVWNHFSENSKEIVYLCIHVNDEIHMSFSVFSRYQKYGKKVKI